MAVNRVDAELLTGHGMGMEDPSRSGPPQPRRKPLHVSINTDLFDRLDQLGWRDGRTRSELIDEAIKLLLEDHIRREREELELRKLRREAAAPSPFPKASEPGRGP